MSAEEKNEDEQLSENLNPPESVEETLKEAQASNGGETSSVASRSQDLTEKSEVEANRKSSQENWPLTTESSESRPTLDDENYPELTKKTSLDEEFKENPTKFEKDGGSCISSTSDICRICHMGGFPAISGSRPIWEWQNRGARRIDSQVSTLSSYAYLGPLISACKGSVGLVHTECLERWLTESGHTRCELCGHRYLTKRVPRHGILRSVIIWFNTVIATRQMLLDILYLFVTTPLALFSCYVCALALKMILESGFQDIPWMIVAMLPTCSLTLVAYWGWLITLGRYISRLHGRRWRRFWRNNFVVQLIPETSNFSLGQETSVENSARERLEYRIARRMDYDDSDFLFDRFPDGDDEDFLQIVENFVHP